MASTSPLLRLPSELRNTVYEMSLADVTTSRINKDGMLVPPAIAQVCRSIRTEVFSYLAHFPTSQACMQHLEAVVSECDFGHVIKFLNALNEYEVTSIIELNIDFRLLKTSWNPQLLKEWTMSNVLDKWESKNFDHPTMTPSRYSRDSTNTPISRPVDQIGIGKDKTHMISINYRVVYEHSSYKSWSWQEHRYRPRPSRWHIDAAYSGLYCSCCMLSKGVFDWTWSSDRIDPERNPMLLLPELTTEERRRFARRLWGLSAAVDVDHLHYEHDLWLKQQLKRPFKVVKQSAGRLELDRFQLKAKLSRVREVVEFHQLESEYDAWLKQQSKRPTRVGKQWLGRSERKKAFSKTKKAATFRHWSRRFNNEKASEHEASVLNLLTTQHGHAVVSWLGYLMV